MTSPRTSFSLVSRQIDLESGPLARFTVNVDKALVLFDNTVHRGEAETRSPVHLLGGEKGLKDIEQGFLVHADAVIADRQHHILARHKSHVPGAVSLVQD